MAPAHRHARQAAARRVHAARGGVARVVRVGVGSKRRVVDDGGVEGAAHGEGVAHHRVLRLCAEAGVRQHLAQVCAESLGLAVIGGSSARRTVDERRQVQPVLVGVRRAARLRRLQQVLYLRAQRAAKYQRPRVNFANCMSCRAAR